MTHQTLPSGESVVRAVVGLGELNVAMGRLVLRRAFDPDVLRDRSSVAAQMAVYLPMLAFEDALPEEDLPAPQRNYAIAGFELDDGSALLVGLAQAPRAMLVTHDGQMWRTQPVPGRWAKQLAGEVTETFSTKDVELARLCDAVTPTVNALRHDMAVAGAVSPEPPPSSPLDPFTALAQSARRNAGRWYRRWVHRRMWSYAPVWSTVECGPGLGGLATDVYHHVVHATPVTTKGLIYRGAVTVGAPLAATGLILRKDLRTRRGLRSQLGQGELPDEILREDWPTFADERLARWRVTGHSRQSHAGAGVRARARRHAAAKSWVRRA